LLTADNLQLQDVQSEASRMKTNFKRNIHKEIIASR